MELLYRVWRPTRALAKFAANLKFEDLPPEVVEAAKIRILDTLGCALFASSTPWCKMMIDLALEWGEKEECTVWGHNVRTSCLNAALVNGTAAHGFELDDTHWEGHVHAGAIVIPTAIAAAEHKGKVSGKDLITAVVVGYETMIRVGMAADDFLGFMMGLHSTGYHGTLGAAAAAGNILDLNEEKIMHAFGIAANQGSGLVAGQYGGMAKRMMCGRAAQSGLMSALLAQKGFTGIPNVLEVDLGYYARFFNRCDLSKIVDGLGKRFGIGRSSLKFYPCMHGNHNHLAALGEMLAKHSFKPEMVDKIIIKTSKFMARHMGFEYMPADPSYEPVDIFRAMFSARYLAAVMLLDGHVWVDSFTDEKLKDPKVLDLARRIVVVVDEEFEKIRPPSPGAASVEVYLKDGRILTNRVDFVKGHPENPATKEDVINKFRKLAIETLGIEKIGEIINTIDHLETVEDISSFTLLLQK